MRRSIRSHFPARCRYAISPRLRARRATSRSRSSRGRARRACPRRGPDGSCAFTGPMRLERFAWLSVAAAIASIALKALAWWLTAPGGLLSVPLPSLVNLAAALLALSMLRLAAAPPDEAHPYGFSKAEYFSAGIEGALIALAAAGIVWTAVPRLIEPRPLEMPFAGLSLTVLASAINFGVATVLLRAGRQHNSITLEADGRHLM